MTGIVGLDHVQLAMPRGEEERARAFYAEVLTLTEVPKPADLAKRGGCWFEGGTAHIHLGGEDDFRPARKAHPALLVDDLDALVARLEAAGVAFTPGKPLDGYKRGDIADPFGNRIELMERV
ncbi:VOC family protein [Erythrobacter sp. LQ02-29]|uniref:VOC family protein n=1 Tax=Erythrobacter sp. LQ02-29 TaxID=2920384 RepID=UPI001F4E6F0B|nr:VOC family protein [Erythrobacter sp. LQ02-29]MCP9222384.1 VOC family protein [Erythrobacter sp. LQ02-29]